MHVLITGVSCKCCYNGRPPNNCDFIWRRNEQFEIGRSLPWQAATSWGAGFPELRLRMIAIIALPCPWLWGDGRTPCCPPNCRTSAFHIHVHPDCVLAAVERRVQLPASSNSCVHHNLAKDHEIAPLAWKCTGVIWPLCASLSWLCKAWSVCGTRVACACPQGGSSFGACFPLPSEVSRS